MSNIYNKFRGVEKIARQYNISKRFDEPTYFSFRLNFSDSAEYAYNIADNTANYDTMPHPLFSRAENKDKIVDNVNAYSAIRYLEDANEPVRAGLLREFIERFDELQNDFNYYFQSIEGISDLLKIDPTKGQRVGNDKKITITCLEGIDLRMSYLINLYRKIAWDDVYQRWVLPDMMRYFTLKIYLAEFRNMQIPTFSRDEKIYGYGNDAAYNKKEFSNINPTSVNLTSLRGMPTTGKDSGEMNTPDIPVFLKVLDNVLPTWQITCEMCEFDLSSISFEHLDNLSVADNPNPAVVKFSIKVGNIKEIQTYPVFKARFLSDIRLNAINRSRSEDTTNEQYTYPASLQIAQNRMGNEDYHISGTPFVERINEVNVNDTRGAIAKPIPSQNLNKISLEESNKVQEGIRGSTFDVNFNPTIPSTWVGNALTWGINYAKNWMELFVNKAKVTPIPSLGVSYSEVKSVMEAKNVIGAFGLIRKGINTVSQYYDNGPSSRLSDPIQTDAIMTDFLVGLSKSKSTDSEEAQIMIEAANNVLNDKGLWEKIKDYSLATDLIGPGEVNRDKKIEGSLELSALYQAPREERKIEQSQIIEASPSSSLGNEINMSNLNQPQLSKATNNNI